MSSLRSPPGTPAILAPPSDKPLADAGVGHPPRLSDWFTAWDRLGALCTPTVAAICGYVLGGCCEPAMLSAPGTGAEAGAPLETVATAGARDFVRTWCVRHRTSESVGRAAGHNAEGPHIRGALPCLLRRITS